jgi:hypothetical protein
VYTSMHACVCENWGGELCGGVLPRALHTCGVLDVGINIQELFDSGAHHLGHAHHVLALLHLMYVHKH